MSLLDLLEVPEARSRASTSATRRPRVAASSATPHPVTPPPMTTTSNSSLASRFQFSARSAGPILAFRRASFCLFSLDTGVLLCVAESPLAGSPQLRRSVGAALASWSHRGWWMHANQSALRWSSCPTSCVLARRSLLRKYPPAAPGRHVLGENRCLLGKSGNPRSPRRNRRPAPPRAAPAGGTSCGPHRALAGARRPALPS